MSNQQTPNQAELNKELSAREIWNRILKGEIVRIPNDPIVASQLKNHLNVIKSREKKLFLDLGLDFISSVISVECVPIVQYFDEQKQAWLDTKPGQALPLPICHKAIDLYEVKLIAPKKRNKYSCFVIKEEQENVQYNPV